MDADYEFSKSYSAQDAQVLVTMAEEFVIFVEGLLPNLLAKEESS